VRRENLAWLRARVAAARRAALAGRLAWWGGAFLAAKALTLALGRAGLLDAAGAAAVDFAAFTALFAAAVFPPRKRLADRTLRKLDPDGHLEALREARGRAAERLVDLETDAHFGELALRSRGAERPPLRAALAFAAGAALFVAVQAWLVASGLGIRLGHAEAIPRSRAGRSEAGQVFAEAAEGLAAEAPAPGGQLPGRYARPEAAGELDELAALERLRDRLARAEAEGAFAPAERSETGSGGDGRSDAEGRALGDGPGAGTASPDGGSGAATAGKPPGTAGVPPESGRAEGGEGSGEGTGEPGAGMGTGTGNGAGEAGSVPADGADGAERGAAGRSAAAGAGYGGSGSSLEASPLVDYRARFERLLSARLSGAQPSFAASPFLSPERYADAVALAFGNLRIGIAATADEEPAALALAAAWAALRKAAR